MIQLQKYFPYLAIAIISVLFYRQCSLPPLKPEIKIVEKVISVPEYVNHFDTIYLPKPFKRTIIDSTYKEMYLKAKDSIERLELYLKAITVKEYNQTFTDTFQTIKVYSKTRGDLLAQTLDYKTFKREIIYKDTIIYPKPRRILSVGIEGNNKLDFKAGFLYTDRKKTIYSIGVNIDKNIYLDIPTINFGIYIPLLK